MDSLDALNGFPDKVPSKGLTAFDLFFFFLYIINHPSLKTTPRAPTSSTFQVLILLMHGNSEH